MDGRQAQARDAARRLDPDLEKKLARPPTVQDLNRARDEQRRRGVYGPQGLLGLDYSLQSENIEDRRGEHFDALVANTEELKRLKKIGGKFQFWDRLALDEFVECYEGEPEDARNDLEKALGFDT
jgi:hypothetical protein